MNWEQLDISVTGLQRHYRAGDFTPTELLEYLLAVNPRYTNKNIWIHLLNREELAPYLEKLRDADPKTLPLYGVPFAIKDNIDLAGIPTTAACPEFAYTPGDSAFVVQRLLAAGAIPLGKTNMDQFATGLVGTRSLKPCRNAFNDDWIAGGSSSGSAVAVALGLVSFALGTDTAGSGRVPAALNNIVGFKPSKGLLSTRGVVPACRSLDVVSIFALTAEDANSVFDCAAGYDASDPYARDNTFANGGRTRGVGTGRLDLAVPDVEHLEFFDDEASRIAFQKSLQAWRSLGAHIREIDFRPFIEAAKLLYEGPWVTERYIASKPLLQDQPEAMHPVVRQIIEVGAAHSAEATFTALYRLQTLKKHADAQLADVDFLITPTTATRYRIASVLAEPVRLNSRLGYYTNFVNLLDYSAIALPNTLTEQRVPSGFTLVGRSFADQKLLAWGKTWQNALSDAPGALSVKPRITEVQDYRQQQTIAVAVCGAHLQGQPLNWQLTERGGRLLKKTSSSAAYRLYALADGKRPGMVRDAKNGRAIEVEVWTMPSENFGGFVAGIPEPLGIGKMELLDGTWVPGFICEPWGLQDAREITEFGGWRAYRQQTAPPLAAH